METSSTTDSLKKKAFIGGKKTYATGKAEGLRKLESSCP